MTRIFKGGGGGGSEYVLAVRVQTSRGGVGEILARENKDALYFILCIFTVEEVNIGQSKEEVRDI